MTYSVNDGFPYYIQCLGNKDYLQTFSSPDNMNFLQSISEEQSTHRYAADKWSIKQILGHITDHERIMIYRILRFSKKDPTFLPGYDQNIFMENSRFDELPYEQLLNDFECVRKASISFIHTLSTEQLILKGKAWIFELTVEDFLKSTIGHELHHIKIIKDRYIR